MNNTQVTLTFKRLNKVFLKSVKCSELNLVQKQTEIIFLKAILNDRLASKLRILIINKNKKILKWSGINFSKCKTKWQ